MQGKSHSRGWLGSELGPGFPSLHSLLLSVLGVETGLFP